MSDKSKKLFGGLKGVAKGFGKKATELTDKVGGVDKVSSIVSQEKASEATRKLLKIITQVARDVKKELPSDMVKAVDLSAELSFIAFTIGVQVDLEQVQLSKKSTIA
jgi:hypothetical protein